MSFSYRPLWITLASKEMTKKDLIKQTGLSSCIMSRLKNRQNISTATLDRICNTLNCRIEDVMEHIPNNETETEIKKHKQ